MPAHSPQRIAAFVGLTALFTAPFWWFITQHRGTPAIADAGYGLMWGPAFAALVVGRAADLGWTWPARRDLLLGWLIPVGYAIVAYVPAWIAGAGTFAAEAEVAGAREYLGLGLGDAGVVALTVGSALTLQLLPNAALALGEELGWRGYLVPALRRHLGLRATGVVSGLIWAAWHYPMFFLATHRAGPSMAWELGWFTLMLAANGVTLAWLRMRSASVWPAVIFHASHNAFIAALDSLTGDTGRTRWILSETGVALALTSTAVAVYVTLRSDVTDPPSPASDTHVDRPRLPAR